MFASFKSAHLDPDHHVEVPLRVLLDDVPIGETHLFCNIRVEL
jgi:hypothetical protein